MSTKHFHTRCQQRGYKASDLDLILRYGTKTPKGVILTNKDVAGVERDLKRRMDRLRKLGGAFVATDGATAITIYRATKKQRRRQLGQW